jgi:hypothetical protein
MLCPYLIRVNLLKSFYRDLNVLCWYNVLLTRRAYRFVEKNRTLLVPRSGYPSPVKFSG